MKSTLPLRLVAALALTLALLPGCEKKPAAPPPAPKPVSAVPTSFEAVTRHLDPGGSAYCYLSTDQILKWLSAYRAAMEPVLMQGVTGKMDAAGKARTEAVWRFAVQFIGQCGLKEISGLGYSSIALEPGYLQKKVMFYRDPAKKDGLIWKIHGTEPNPLAFIDYLPAHTAVASSGNTKLLPVWEQLNRQAAGDPGVKQSFDGAAQAFQKTTGLDLAALLGSLGPNYSTVLTLDEANPVTLPAGQAQITIPEPALGFWVQVQDDVLIKKLEETLSKTPMASKSETGGWTVYKLGVPIPLPWVHPAVAWKQGTVALFSNDALFAEMLAVKAGKKPGLAASADFTKLRKGMPESGEGFSYMAPSFQKAIQAVQMATTGAKVAQDPAAKQLMEKVYALSGASAIYSVGNETDDGILSISHEKKPWK